MNIHELNTKAITSPAYVALDDGEDTYKLNLATRFNNTDTAISEIMDDVSDLDDHAQISYGETSTSAGTATKVVTVNDPHFGRDGDYLVIKFTNGNTASTMGVNISGYGTSQVRFNGSTTVPPIEAGAMLLFHMTDISGTAPAPYYRLDFVGYYPKSKFEEIDEELDDFNNAISQMSGLSEDVKTALLQLASKVAYIDEDGQDYYDALYDAFYPPSDLVSISAVYTQSGTVYDTDTLDSLKPDLVVTAHYSDQTTETISTYTLSGSLTEGTSTITVSYLGKTTTFTVTVSHLIAEFEVGAIAKGTNNSTPQYRYAWETTATARARMTKPILNKGYVFTTTDPTKYQVNATDAETDVAVKIQHSTLGQIDAYYCGTKTITWADSDSVTTDYVWLALKKLDNTDFTAEELADGASAVFTYTEQNA